MNTAALLSFRPAGVIVLAAGSRLQWYRPNQAAAGGAVRICDFCGGEDPGPAHDPRSRDSDCCVCRELTSLPTRTDTRRQAGRSAAREGGERLLGLRGICSRNPHALASRFGWGESRARQGGRGGLFPACLRMTARCRPRPTSATTGRAAPWACAAAR